MFFLLSLTERVIIITVLFRGCLFSLVNDGIHFVFVQSSYPIFRTHLAQNNRTFVSEKLLVTSGNFCLRISLTCLYVLLSSVRFLIKVTLLSIYSAIFVSWLVGQSIQSRQMAPKVDICQSVGFETAFKYSFKTPFIFKVPFSLRTSLPTAKKVPFLLFW